MKLNQARDDVGIPGLINGDLLLSRKRPTWQTGRMQVDALEPIADETPTLSRVAYERLREEIVSGSLVANQPLRLEQLRERYGLSFSPLREALNQLQVERLVVSSSKRGFRVAPFSLADMWDAIRTRILIEGEALRQSLAHGDDEWEDRIISSYRALERSRHRIATEKILGTDELAVLERRHDTFHTALLQACPSPLLLQISRTLYAHTERYRRPLLSRVAPETMGQRRPDDEHRDLMDAALARDTKRSIGLLATHLTGTGRFIEETHLDGVSVTASSAQSSRDRRTRRVGLRKRTSAA